MLRSYQTGKLQFCILLVCLLHVVHQTKANWDEGQDDPSYSNLGFYQINVSCSDNGNECTHCYEEKNYGLVVIHSFEFFKNPAKFMFSSLWGSDEYKILMRQANASEPFRTCMAVDDLILTSVVDIRLNLCVDNKFEGLTIPAHCTNPLAVVSLDSHVADRRMRGQQVLYCAPQQA